MAPKTATVDQRRVAGSDRETRRIPCRGRRHVVFAGRSDRSRLAGPGRRFIHGKRMQEGVAFVKEKLLSLARSS